MVTATGRRPRGATQPPRSQGCTKCRAGSPSASPQARHISFAEAPVLSSGVMCTARRAPGSWSTQGRLCCHLGTPQAQTCALGNAPEPPPCAALPACTLCSVTGRRAGCIGNCVKHPVMCWNTRRVFLEEK